MKKILNTVDQVALGLFMLLLPLFYLPFFQSRVVLPKMLLLGGTVALVVAVRATKLVLGGRGKIKLSRYDVGVLGLVVAYLVSSFVKTPNKFDAFWLPGRASILLFGGLFFILLNQASDKAKKAYSELLIYGGALLAIFVALVSFEVFSIFDTNPMGTYLSVVVYLVALLPLAIGQLLSERNILEKVLVSLALVLIVFGAALSTINFMDEGGFETLLPLKTSRTIAVDAIKNDNWILGMGPGNYLTAFNRYRPLEYNQTDLWNTKFTTGRNLYHTTLTEVGLLGTGALVLIVVVLAGEIKKNWKDEICMAAGLLLLLLVFFPPNIVHVLLVFVLLALQSSTENVYLPLSTTKSKLPTYVLASLMVVPFVVLGIFTARYTLAEAYYKRVLVALAEGKAESYDLAKENIKRNNYIDRYRGTYAQINIALANSLAKETGGTVDDDEKRNQIAALIQQAIREAKATVALNPWLSGNWEILGSTYRAIAPFTQGAEQFSVEAYKQAVALDPINPNLRIALGGLYFAQGDYDSAIETFKLAVLAKQDLPNAHYNLAYAYKGKGEFEKATAEMEAVLSLVEPQSKDYEKAQKELEDLKSEGVVIDTNQAVPVAETLEAPSETQEAITPLLPLPEEATGSSETSAQPAN